MVANITPANDPHYQGKQMNIEITTCFEEERGCGYRQEGGLYLVSGKRFSGCGKMPVRLDVCPTCSHGIKPSRGWTWVNATQLLDVTCTYSVCLGCPARLDLGRAGLLWIGGRYYKTVESFADEANRLGVSRRLASVPKDFELGKTWVLLAHREAVANPDGTKSAGIFGVFMPERIEYVVKTDDSPDKLERLVKRGISLVRVERKPREAYA